MTLYDPRPEKLHRVQWTEIVPPGFVDRELWFDYKGADMFADGLAAYWFTLIEEVWLPARHDSTLVTSCTVTRISDSVAWTVSPKVLHGRQSGPAAPPGESVVLEFLTDDRSRGWNRRWFLNGLAAAHVTGGQLSEEGVRAWTTYAQIAAESFLGLWEESYCRLHIPEPLPPGGIVPAGYPATTREVECLRLHRWTQKAFGY